MVVNAWKLHHALTRSLDDDCHGQIKFREKLAYELIGSHERDRAPPPKRSYGPLSTSSKCLPWKLEDTAARYCVHCRAHRTAYVCAGCHVPLCVARCFAVYHNPDMEDFQLP